MLSRIEEIIDEARNGRMFIVVDDANRESESSLIIPAQMATPDAINFMSKYGRSLVCLALTKLRCDQLGLDLMKRTEGRRDSAAFTVSIEAREGVTTGISVADRARTIAVAINGLLGEESIVKPGHVFPLVASDGGVLVRAGHTEAAVDISRLAGLNASGAICQVIREDGTMAQMEDLVEFSKKHGLKIGSIRDLIAHRRKYDRLIRLRSEAKFTSRWGGEWKVLSFLNTATKTEQVALVKGVIGSRRPTLVRMHSLSTFPDLFGGTGDRASLLQRSMEIISEEGNGLVVVMPTTTPDVFSHAIESIGNKDVDTSLHTSRDYGAGAQVLTELGVSEMILLTNNHQPYVALDGYGLTIKAGRPII